MGYGAFSLRACACISIAIGLLAASPVLADSQVELSDEDLAQGDEWKCELLHTTSDLVVPYIGLDYPLGPVTHVGQHEIDGSRFFHCYGRTAGNSVASCSPTPPPGQICEAASIYAMTYTGDAYDPAESGAAVDIDVLLSMTTTTPAGWQAHPSGFKARLAASQGGITYASTEELALLSNGSVSPSWQIVEGSPSLAGSAWMHTENGQAVQGGPNFVDGGPIEFGVAFETTGNWTAHGPTSCPAGSTDCHPLVIPHSAWIRQFDLTLHQQDTDDDGYADASDNCTQEPNGSQCDTDADGYGNHCDGDIYVPNDNIVGGPDFATFGDSWSQTYPSPDYNPDADFTCDGAVGGPDYGIWVQQFNRKAPGPSGLSCAGEEGCGDL
jgi:hypothetical protein